MAELESAVKHIATARTWNATEPFPTTREFGERFGISNASVCRLLKRLGEEGVIWRRENGRYYPVESRRLYERRKPYACLIRKLQHWSRMYHAIMSGFSQAFGGKKTSMLFVHNETLVRHADTAHPPVHAGLAAQREALADFFHDHEDQFAGILFDDVWLDDALAKYAGRLGNSVVVCRTTALPDLSSVSADFDSSALVAIGHLHARGFEEIWLALPFAHSAPVDLMHAAVLRAAASLGSPLDPKNIHPAATPTDREKLIHRVKAAKKRIGLFCLEDNVTLRLWRALRQAGIDCPRQCGLLSGMGDIVSDHGISSIRIDYEAIGRTAGEILAANEYRVVKLPTQLSLGTTT